jgi:hypothetical protein
MAEANPLDLEKSEEDIMPSELDVLKQRARIMGITFSNNISVEKLREKITAAQEGASVNEEPADAGQANGQLNPLQGDTADKPAKVKVKSIRQHIMEESMKLIRVRITNMDPKKKELQGEIFTVANEYLGTVRKFVPFGEATEDGYHIPKCIYDLMASRKFLQIRTRKNRKTGTEEVEATYVREFSLEVLDPLTPAQLKDLATQQAAAGSVNY